MANAPEYITPGSDLDIAQQQLQQRIALANMLRQQSLQPLKGQMVGDVYVGASPFEGIANLAKAYAGSNMQSEAYDDMREARQNYDHQTIDAVRQQLPNADDSTVKGLASQYGPAKEIAQARLGQQMLMEKIANAVRMANGQIPGQQGGQAGNGQPSKISGAFGNVPANAVGFMLSGDPGAMKVGEAIASQSAPSEDMKLSQALSSQGNNPLYQALLSGIYNKKTSEATRNGLIWNAATGQFTAAPTGLIREQSAANAEGGLSGHLTQVFDPSTNQMVYVTGAQAAGISPNTIKTIESGNNPNAVSPKGAQGTMQVMPGTSSNPGFGVAPAKNNSSQELERVGNDYYAKMNEKYGNPTLAAIAYNMGPGATDKWIASGGKYQDLPQETKDYIANAHVTQAISDTRVKLPQSQQQGGLPASPPLGKKEGVEKQQEELSKNWASLNAQNQQAQTTNSYLQDIRLLAPKAATGPMSDKIAFVNGLLSLVGSEKAKDAVTANNLLDKYKNQIVSRLGSSGGLATDQARAVIESAYPNSKMNVDAINDAVDNLIGSNKMIQAKTQLLSQHAANRDPIAYQKNEINFDKNADPRAFQFVSMQPEQRQKYFNSLNKQQQDDLRSRINNLNQMGAL